MLSLSEWSENSDEDKPTFFGSRCLWLLSLKLFQSYEIALLLGGNKRRMDQCRKTEGLSVVQTADDIINGIEGKTTKLHRFWRRLRVGRCSSFIVSFQWTYIIVESAFIHCC